MTPKRSASAFFKHLRNFEDNQESEIPVAARYLFVKLLKQADDHGWGVPLSLPNSEVMGWVGVSTRQGLSKIRASLIDAGLLIVAGGFRGRAPLYHLLLGNLSEPNLSTTVTHSIEEPVNHSSRISANLSTTVTTIEPSVSLHTPHTPRSGLGEDFRTWLIAEARANEFKVGTHKKLTAALDSCERLSIPLSTMTSAYQSAANAKGTVDSPPGLAAWELAQLCENYSNGTHGIREMVDALPDAPEPQAIWDHIKSENLVAEFDETRIRALMERLAKRWPRTEYDVDHCIRTLLITRNKNLATPTEMIYAD